MYASRPQPFAFLYWSVSMMPTHLADPLYDRLLGAFPPNRAYSETDWADDAIPAPVQHFLKHLLRHRGRREARRLRRASTDWVNYDHPEMETAVRAFFEAAEAHAQVPADAWEETLQHAVSETTAYLVRPVPTLVDFVFERPDDSLSIDRIQWRMKFFRPYPYLREAVRAYGEKQGLAALSVEPFESVLTRVDRHIPADFDADRWLRALDPLFATARCAHGAERLSVSLLQAFFEEKDQVDIVTRLKRYAEEGHEEVGPKALYGLIDEAGSPSSGTTATSSSRPSTEAVSATNAQPEQDRSTPLWKQFQQGRVSGSSATDGSPGDEPPLWTQFRRDKSTRASHITADEDPDSDSVSPPEGNGDSTSTGAARASAARDEEEAGLKTLERDVLGAGPSSHRRVYVQTLFDGNRTEYQQVLRRLRAAESWGEASQIIARDIFRKHGVNIYSDAAVHFTDAVEASFRAPS